MRYSSFTRVSAVFLPCLGLAVLTGCAPPAPFDFSLNSVSPSPTVINYDLKSTVVTLASPSEKTGPLPAESSFTVPIWQSALEDAMDRSAIFADPAPGSADLECKILKIDVPDFGGAMTTDIAARYQIIDRSSGKILFDEIVDTRGTVPFGYSLIGVIRSRESVNVAAQNNIAAFLHQIEYSHLAKLRTSSPTS